MFFISQFSKLSIAFEFEEFFGEENEDRQFFEQHTKTFGYDNDYLLVSFNNEPSVFESGFLKKIKDWKLAVAQLKDVQGVQSLFDLKHLIKSPYGIIPIPLLHLQDPNQLNSDSIRIMSHPLYSHFISSDAKSILIQLNHQHFKDPKSEQIFYEDLQSSLLENGLTDYRLVGKLIAQKSFIDHIKSDFSLFLSLGILVTILLLLLIYRSIQIMLLPLLLSLTSLIFLLGLMAVFKVELSVLSVLIPPIILFVSTSDAIHLMNAYRQNNNPHFLSRLLNAIKKVFSATLLTSVTTAIGFFSLLMLPTQPIRELGLFAGIGVLIAFAVNFLFGPLLIRKDYKRAALKLPYRAFALLVMKNKRLIISAYVILIVISIFGVSQLKTDAYLLNDLPKDDQVRQDFAYMDQYFGGSKPWEMAIYPAQAHANIFDYQFLLQAEKIEQYLMDSFGIQKLFSPLAVAKYANQIENGGNLKYYDFGDYPNFLKSEKIRKQLITSGLAKGLVDSTAAYARFSALIPEWGSFKSREKNLALNQFITREIDGTILKAKITGTTYLIDKSNEDISIDLLKGLLLATLLISMVLAIYFKSFKMLLISLIPNFIPLLFTAAIMGFMGVPFKLTTAIIFVVAFGVAVDDTIHFLGAYKKQKATTKIWRIIKTLKSAGLAILITSILIIGGFILFTLSAFATTFYLGLFLSLAMFFALITDLFLLPLLLKQ